MPVYNIILVDGGWRMDTEGNILVKGTDSGNILAIEQPRIDFNENNQPFIKETNIILGYKVLRLLTLCLNLLNKTQCWTTLHKTHCLTAAPTGNMMRLWRLYLRWKLDMRILYHPKKMRWFWDVISESLSSDGINVYLIIICIL
nr:unnamed protein product [Callosobruchus analis]